MKRKGKPFRNTSGVHETRFPQKLISTRITSHSSLADEIANVGSGPSSAPAPSSPLPLLPPSFPPSSPVTGHDNLNGDRPASPTSLRPNSPCTERALRMAPTVPQQPSRRPPPIASRKRPGSASLSGAAKRPAIGVPTSDMGDRVMAVLGGDETVTGPGGELCTANSA